MLNVDNICNYFSVQVQVMKITTTQVYLGLIRSRNDVRNRMLYRNFAVIVQQMSSAIQNLEKICIGIESLFREPHDQFQFRTTENSYKYRIGGPPAYKLLYELPMATTLNLESNLHVTV